MSEIIPNQPAARAKNARAQTLAGLGISLADIYYGLFRWKWMIGLLSFAGFSAALLYYWRAPIMYQSESKLLIRYVIDKSPVNLMAGEASQVKTPDPGGRNIINTELEILTSFDLAKAVAQAIGPDRILAKVNGGTNLSEAAAVIKEGVRVQSTRYSDAIRISLEHRDPAITQPILSKWVELYLEKQAEIRGADGFDTFLVKELDQLQTNLRQTQQALRQAKAQAKVISLEDSTKAYADQMSRIRAEILNTEAELAERQASVTEMMKRMPEKAAALTNQVKLATNEVAMAASSKVDEYKRVVGLLELLRQREQSLLLQFTPENHLVKGVRQQIAENDTLRNQLERENPDLAAQLMPSSLANTSVSEPSVEAQEIERFARASAATQAAALHNELARVSALQSRMNVLTNQLESIWERASALDDMEGTIMDLQRREELASARYKSFATSLEQARLQQAMGEGQISNMSLIQAPSPPLRVVSKLYLTMAAILFVSVAGALALAFLIEFYLDGSLKRSIEVEPRLNVPLVLSIPSNEHEKSPWAKVVSVFRRRRHPLCRTKPAASTKIQSGTADEPNTEHAPAQPSPEKKRSRFSKLMESVLRFSRRFAKNRTTKSKGHEAERAEAANGDPSSAHGSPSGKKAVFLKVIKSLARLKRRFSRTKTAKPAKGEPEPAAGAAEVVSDENPELQIYYDTLRDRLINHFDLNNLTHKPKLVAVTSCGKGCGVTSVAVGLAASLSEAGDGSILLVDMNGKHASANQVYRSRPECHLDEVLENGKRQEALLQGNLYVVSEGGNGKPANGTRNGTGNGNHQSRVLPRRFTELVPRLKASEYDFIIFDMPPVSQTSVTPKLARFMDMVLFVVEAEKTDGDIARRATAWLTDSRAAVGVVLNKERTYVPEWLQQKL